MPRACPRYRTLVLLDWLNYAVVYRTVIIVVWLVACTWQHAPCTNTLPAPRRSEHDIMTNVISIATRRVALRVARIDGTERLHFFGPLFRVVGPKLEEARVYFHSAPRRPARS